MISLAGMCKGCKNHRGKPDRSTESINAYVTG